MPPPSPQPVLDFPRPEDAPLWLLGAMGLAALLSRGRIPLKPNELALFAGKPDFAGFIRALKAARPSTQLKNLHPPAPAPFFPKAAAEDVMEVADRSPFPVVKDIGDWVEANTRATRLPLPSGPPHVVGVDPDLIKGANQSLLPFADRIISGPVGAGSAAEYHFPSKTITLGPGMERDSAYSRRTLNHELLHGLQSAAPRDFFQIVLRSFPDQAPTSYGAYSLSESWADMAKSSGMSKSSGRWSDLTNLVDLWLKAARGNLKSSLIPDASLSNYQELRSFTPTISRSALSFPRLKAGHDIFTGSSRITGDRAVDAALLDNRRFIEMLFELFPEFTKEKLYTKFHPSRIDFQTSIVGDMANELNDWRYSLWLDRLRRPPPDMQPFQRVRKDVLDWMRRGSPIPERQPLFNNLMLRRGIQYP